MRYYPVEYIAAMLNSVMGISEKVAYYIRFAESLGIQVLPPDINESYTKFTVKGDTIRFGMGAIKNVGLNVVESIVKARNQKGRFASIMDFCNKVDLGAINKRAVESLIKAGAFDEFKIFRSKLLAVHEKIMDSVANQRKRNIDGQISLFGAIEEQDSSVFEVQYPNIREFDKKTMLAMEKEMTGLYITGHPLDEYDKSLKLQTTTVIEKIINSREVLEENVLESELDIQAPAYSFSDGERVVVGGIISSVSRKVTRNNTIMAFITLEDLTGTIEAIVFPKTLEKINSLINEEQLVIIKGRVSIREEEMPKLICEDIQPLEKIDSSKIYLKIDDVSKMREITKILKVLISEYKGETPLYLFAAKERQTFRASKDLWVNLNEGALEFLREKFGEENVKVVE